MAYRFVRARPKRDRRLELRERLERGDIAEMEPFGRAMTKSLDCARFDPDTGEAAGWARVETLPRLWERVPSDA